MLSRFILSLRDFSDPNGSYRKQKPPTSINSLDEIGGPVTSYDTMEDFDMKADFDTEEDYGTKEDFVSTIEWAPVDLDD